MTNNKKGGYKVGTVISGAQSVDNNVVPVVSSGKNQSVNGQKFGDIMAKSVGGNAGKKNCRNCTDDCFQTGNQIRIDCGTVVFRKDYIFTQTVCTASCKWNASPSDRSR